MGSSEKQISVFYEMSGYNSISYHYLGSQMFHLVTSLCIFF